MRTRLAYAALGLLTALPAAAVSRVVDEDNQATTGDCDALLTTPRTFMTIQAAIDASASGDTIFVCPGTYDEQPEISGKSLTITGRGDATVRPAPMDDNSTNLFSGLPIAAGILVEDATNVTIGSIGVDGTDNGGTDCTKNPVGIYYRNASGTVRDVAVRNMKLGPGLEGCQGGTGVFVQSGLAGSSSVSVLGSSIHSYQKNGITGNEAGTTLTARENRVTGLGPTPFIAQNGIQIGFGAAGGIEDNVIANHVYTACTSPSSCAAAATGVLIFEAADGVMVRSNTVAHGQVGILAQANGMTIGGNANRSNDITQTLVFDGIAVVGDNNLVRGNNVTHSDRSGIFIEGTGNTIRNNRINEAPIGIWNFSGTNTIPPPPPGLRNTFFNVGVAIHSGMTPPAVSTLLREAAARLTRMAVPSPVR